MHGEEAMKYGTAGRMWIGALAVLAMTAGACDDKATTVESPGADACEHFASGPIRAITAGADAATAADASAEHTRWDVTLAAVGGAGHGFLAIEIDAVGDHTFFFDRAVTLTMRDGNGATVVPEASATSDADCAEVGGAFTFELAVGTYSLELSSSSTDLLGLVWFGAGEEHEH
jgi:hypothetical protein